MWSAAISVIAKAFVDLLSRIIGDWRRDRALEEKGAAEERARVAASVAAAERRAAAVPPRSEDETIVTLEKGEF